ncbi:MAG: MarC family protein [Pricia sp.]
MLTEGADERAKNNINRKAVLIVFVIVAIFLVLGQFILHYSQLPYPNST